MQNEYNSLREKNRTFSQVENLSVTLFFSFLQVTALEDFSV